MNTMMGELPGPTKNIFISLPIPNCTMQFRAKATPQRRVKIQVAEAYHYWLFGHYHDNKAVNEKHILLWEQIVRVI